MSNAIPSPSVPVLGLPAGFVWGASTSSYQIEGAADEDGRGQSVWDLQCRLQNAVRNGDTGDVACDHYHRYREDIALMQDLGIQAYRFSIAWPRILPRGRGRVNEKGLDFYDRLIDGLLTAGVEPWICLYHGDLPLALHADLGGWASRDSAGYFADYAMLAARRYGDRVQRWATFNEQGLSAILAHLWGWSPLHTKSRDAYFRAVHHQNLAHGAAIDALRAQVRGASLGIIHNRQRVYPERDDLASQDAAEAMDLHWNRIFPDAQILGAYPEAVADEFEPYVRAGDLSRICRPLDWFGINHYSPIYAGFNHENLFGFGFGAAPGELPRSDIGWPIMPEGFCADLLEIHRRYRLPIYVTENGYGSDKETSDAEGCVQDDRRIAYLRGYTTAMAEAVRNGADVRGYFVWSLLDNFEWGAGYANRFGIVRVDFETQKRTPKASARWYAELIRANGGG